jgi:excisionase family DNA binding protein
MGFYGHPLTWVDLFLWASNFGNGGPEGASGADRKPAKGFDTPNHAQPNRSRDGVQERFDVVAKSASRPESVEPPLLYRLPEAARLLGISLAYLYVLKAAGKIRVRSIGRAARIHRDDLEAFAAGAPTAPLKYGSQPSGPLLGPDQQRLAVARVNDPPKRRRRKAKTKAKARARPRVLQGPAHAPEPEPRALIDQQQPVVEQANGLEPPPPVPEPEPRGWERE